MSRSGYTDDIDSQEAQWAHICWRGAVASAIRGRRGQALLRQIAAALDAMPEKRLIANSLEHPLGGQFCTLGAVLHAKGIDTNTPEIEEIASDDHEELAKLLSCAPALAREIMYENDEYGYGKDTPEQQQARWRYMRNWVQKHITWPKVSWLPAGVMEVIGAYSDLYPYDYDDYIDTPAGFDPWFEA